MVFPLSLGLMLSHNWLSFSLFKKMYVVFNYVYGCGFVHMSAGDLRSQPERVSNPLELELRRLGAPHLPSMGAGRQTQVVFTSGPHSYPLSLLSSLDWPLFYI